MGFSKGVETKVLWAKILSDKTLINLDPKSISEWSSKIFETPLADSFKVTAL